MNPAPPSTSGELAPGARFHGRYLVVRELGAGGMGFVYEVIDEPSGAPRALKVMHAALARRSAHRARFEQEARVTSTIDSEHLVRVFDAGVAGETPFIVMELLRGRGVDAVLRDRGRMGPSEVCALLSDVARALDQTHGAGIVHRDLKPENLFLTSRADGSPCVKILDFGVAKIFKDAAAPLTRTVGTPLFMSPEQIRGDGDVGPRADVYGLVQVAYDLLVGEPYWSEESRPDAPVLSLMVRVLAGPVEPASARALRRAGVALPAAFDAWFTRGTAAASAERFASASQAIAELAALFPFATPGAGAPGLTAPSAPRSSAFDAAGPTMSPEAAFGSAVATGPTQLGYIGASATLSAARDLAVSPTRLDIGATATLNAALAAGPTRSAPAPSAPQGQPPWGMATRGAPAVIMNATPELATMVSAGATQRFGGAAPDGAHQEAPPLQWPTAPPPHLAAPARPRRAARWPWIVGAVIAMAAVAATAAVLLTRNPRKNRDADDERPGDRRADVRTSTSGSGSASGSGPAPSSSVAGPPCPVDGCAPLDFPDLGAVPADPLFARARALATSVSKDAVLIQLVASGIWTDGALDLRGSPGLVMSFRGTSEDVTIMVFAQRLIATRGPHVIVGAPVPEPGCTFAEMAAILRAANFNPRRGTLHFLSVHNTPSRVRVSDETSASMALDAMTCKIVRE